jgi:aminoglycoside phosphotransferase (APT) family kinase protein
MLDVYAAGSGRDLSQIGFYLGLAHFKLAVILEGIHYRYTQGQTVGAGFDTIGAVVEPLIDAGITSLKENS